MTRQFWSDLVPSLIVALGVVAATYVASLTAESGWLVVHDTDEAVAGDGLGGKGEEDNGRIVGWCSAGHSWIGRVDDIRSGAIIVPHFSLSRSARFFRLFPQAYARAFRRPA